MSELLHTADEVFHVLGGNVGVREIAQAKSHQTVLHWRKTRKFPANRFFIITVALNRRGYRAPPELFSQVTEAPAGEAINGHAAE